jgi:hypothetical protein
MYATKRKPVLEVVWTGPYCWPQFASSDNPRPIPEHPGVYLQTVRYHDGYLVYAAGLTRRPIPARFREHTRKYMSGDYTVLDIAAMQRGIRKEIWHGWGWSPAKRAEFETRRQAIIDAAKMQLRGFRIFTADVGTQPRILERLEASIMNSLYQQSPPFCDIPDRGMMLSPRWDSELPIIVENKCAALLHGIPLYLEI